tara:strand:- start:1228 stop:2388 length:1161 start_codon:yes stop_codon:yes gene_type:complete
MATTIKIWDGTATFTSGSSTPFGLYDSDSTFRADAPKVAKWCAKRIGYPIVDIELQSGSFFACFEEAVTEYNSQVNRFNIRENLLTLQGAPTSSNYSGKDIQGTGLPKLINLSKEYGSEAGVGGNVTWYSGSITTSANQQVYDLTNTGSTAFESGTPGTDAIEIKRIFHQASPAITRFFDPYVGTSTMTQQQLSEMGWSGFSPAINHMMMPMYDDLLRMQAIEFNDVVRKSAYSFELQNNRLRIFPIPSGSFKVHFQYIKTDDRSDASAQDNVISDFSNITYNHIEYRAVNNPGKQWIKKYTLALTKELLGAIRSKYGSIPSPGDAISLDGDTLRSEGIAEKEALVSELREDLEASSRRNAMERQNDEANFHQETINKVPLGIYIG